MQINVTGLLWGESIGGKWLILRKACPCPDDIINSIFTLLWRHNDHDCVSNHQPRGCLLNRLFRRRSKKTSKLRVTGLCVGNSPGPVNSPHKGPVTRKMFPFDDVIMKYSPSGIDGYCICIYVCGEKAKPHGCWIFFVLLHVASNMETTTPHGFLC